MCGQTCDPEAHRFALINRLTLSQNNGERE